MWPFRSKLPLQTKLFFIHVMKTAGTSFRQMLTRALPDQARLYPNDRDLAESLNGHYPKIADLIEQKRRGRLRPIDVLCGHYPAFLGELFFDEPFHSVTFLRHPLGRSLSMIGHKQMGQFAGRPADDILDDERFVKRSIENYQTKIFAFSALEECGESVHTELPIDDDLFELACRRLREVTFVGLTERFEESVAAIKQLTGLRFGKVLRSNPTRSKPDVAHSNAERRILDLNWYDLRLYELAQQLFEEKVGQGVA